MKRFIGYGWILWLAGLMAGASAVAVTVPPSDATDLDSSATTTNQQTAIDDDDAELTPSVLPESTPAANELKLSIPVQWQLTRARIVESGASTVTETFRETWTLIEDGDGLHQVQSPRARVAVAVVARSADDTQAPQVLAMTEEQFAQLVGIPYWNDQAVDKPAPSMVTLDLRRAQRADAGTDFVFNFSDDEHYAVHLEVGQRQF